MKLFISLVAAAAIYLSLTLGLSAQQACPTCPSEGGGGSPLCPATTIEECPAEGCGGWDRQLNCRKNLTCDPSRNAPVQYTLDEIKKLPYPQGWYSGKDRAELASLGEGRHVIVTARLLRAEQGPPNFANCKLFETKDRDILLLLVPDSALKKKQTRQQRELMSVTAELTPRVRLAHKKWTQENLGKLLSHGALYVRLTGLLLLDTGGAIAPVEHAKARISAAPVLRATDWEIHPVLEIEVCRSKKCADDGDWKKLDDTQIPAWSNRPVDSESVITEGEETGPVVVPRDPSNRKPIQIRMRGRRRG